MPLSNEALLGRFDDLARRVGSVEHELRDNRPAVLAAKLDDLEGDVSGIRHDLTEFRREFIGEVKSLRRAVIGFAITVAGSAVAFALTVILVWGAPS
ncbi:MAG TPA: hypothetical protein VFM38_00750 [Candidatus Limnocylindrales bacterium]|nr:hypothetical protein [Candidatus Limnocylindrales bacterium]